MSALLRCCILRHDHTITTATINPEHITSHRTVKRTVDDRSGQPLVDEDVEEIRMVNGDTFHVNTTADDFSQQWANALFDDPASITEVG